MPLLVGECPPLGKELVPPLQKLISVECAFREPLGPEVWKFLPEHLRKWLGSEEFAIECLRLAVCPEMLVMRTST